VELGSPNVVFDPMPRMNERQTPAAVRPQAANAAVKAKGTIFAIVYRRLVPRLGHAQAIGAIAHRLCRVIWKILHDGVKYEERGSAITKHRAQRRAVKIIREFRVLGDHVEQVSALREQSCMIAAVFRPWTATIQK
jgi:hypothetical protein